MEPLPACPHCDETLRPWRWCLRICRRSHGETDYLWIRILFCDTCQRSHRQLPDCLVPHKHYDAVSIEAGLQDGTTAAVAADESTIYRWHHWFRAWSVYAVGVFVALQHRGAATESVEPSRSLPPILRLLGRWVGDASGWLARAVLPMVRGHYWQCFPG